MCFEFKFFPCRLHALCLHIVKGFIFYLNNLALVFSGYMQTDKMTYHPKTILKKMFKYKHIWKNFFMGEPKLATWYAERFELGLQNSEGMALAWCSIPCDFSFGLWLLWLWILFIIKKEKERKAKQRQKSHEKKKMLSDFSFRNIWVKNVHLVLYLLSGLEYAI